MVIEVTISGNVDFVFFKTYLVCLVIIVSKHKVCSDTKQEKEQKLSFDYFLWLCKSAP